MRTLKCNPIFGETLSEGELPQHPTVGVIGLSQREALSGLLRCVFYNLNCFQIQGKNELLIAPDSVSRPSRMRSCFCSQIPKERGRPPNHRPGSFLSLFWVTYVSGTFCYLCLRYGQTKTWWAH